MAARTLANMVLLTLAVAGNSAKAQSQPSGPPPRQYKSCETELSEKGIVYGAANYRELIRECEARYRKDVREGAFGIETQVLTLCADELEKRGMTAGIGRFQSELTTCMARRTQEIQSGTAPSAQEVPFGRGKIQDYLNALYLGDTAAIDRINGDFSTAARWYPIASLIKVIAPNYIGMYPFLYKQCLEPDAPSITRGRVYDEVKRDGRGIEISRRTIDNRYQFPVNRRLYGLATKFGVGTTEGSTAGLPTSSRIGEYAAENVNQVVRRTMESFGCEDPKIRQLEDALIKYATR